MSRQFQSTDIQLSACYLALSHDWFRYIYTEDDKRKYVIHLKDGTAHRLTKRDVQVLSDYFAEVANKMKESNEPINTI